MASLRYPKLIALDLDYTLWDLWIGIHICGPLRRNGDKINEVLDRNNHVIAFYKDVPSILHKLRTEGVCIAACSRASAPDLAYEALRLLLVPPPSTSSFDNEQISETKNDGKPLPAIEFFDQLEIYPGSKLTHFTEIHKKTGIPYSEMLFFDDKLKNKEVETLGVTFQLVSHLGLTTKTFDEGMVLWENRNLSEEVTEQ